MAKITMHFFNERMRRLVAADLLPERAGQPVKIMAHISLADLMILDGSSALQEEWTARVRAEWAAHRAAASVGGSDGGAWLDGDAARAMACDAAMTPIVTGDVNPAALRTSSACAFTSTGSATTALAATAPARTTPAPLAPTAVQALAPATLARARPARTPPGPGKPSSRPSSAKPCLF